MLDVSGFKPDYRPNTTLGNIANTIIENTRYKQERDYRNQKEQQAKEQQNKLYNLREIDQDTDPTRFKTGEQRFDDYTQKELASIKNKALTEYVGLDPVEAEYKLSQDMKGLIGWHNAVKSNIENIKTGLLDFNKTYPNINAQKAHELSFLQLGNDFLEKDKEGSIVRKDPSGIDAFHKELVCGMPGLIYSNYANTLPSYSSVPSYATSIINRFDIYDQLAKDMCFSFEENIWSKNFNYGCEWFETVENTMFGWKNGIMWSFNTNTTQWNTFFGTQYPVRICITGNINSSMMKVLNNISIEGDGTIPNYVVALTAVPNQQITDLANTDTVNGESVWVVNEGVAERPFLADRLSPNVSGTADEKLFMGDPLRDFSIFVMCEWQKYDSLLYINFINLGYSESKGMSNLVNVINK